MILKLLSIVVASALLSLPLAASAEEGAVSNNNGGAQSSEASDTPGARAAAAASAKGVRAYAIVVHETFLLNKGFRSVRNPLTGVYCLDPSVDLDLKQIAPSITVEWGESRGDNLSAFYHRSKPVACGKNEIEVLTFAFKAGANNKPSDNVAFVISVP